MATATPAQKRLETALLLRQGGASFRAIAAALGCSPRAAYKLVGRALAVLSTEAKAEQERARDLTLLRLDRAVLALWEDVEKGDVKAIRELVRIETRRAKLLGLDMPTKVALTDLTGQLDARTHAAEFDELNELIRIGLARMAQELPAARLVGSGSTIDDGDKG